MGTLEELKNEFYRLVGLISVDELVSNKQLPTYIETLERRLIAAAG